MFMSRMRKTITTLRKSIVTSIESLRLDDTLVIVGDHDQTVQLDERHEVTEREEALNNLLGLDLPCSRKAITPRR